MKNIFSQDPEPQKASRKPITRRRGRPAKTYFSIQDAMDYISTEGFQTLSEYKNYVIEQKMTDMLPVNPNLYYGKQYPGVDVFLGNPVGTSKVRIANTLVNPENRAKALEVRRQNRMKRFEELKAEATKVASKAKKIQSEPTSTVPSLSVCFGVLLEHNVSFSTLNKVNKEMANITPKEAREITSVLLEFLTKEDKVIA